MNSNIPSTILTNQRICSLTKSTASLHSVPITEIKWAIDLLARSRDPYRSPTPQHFPKRKKRKEKSLNQEEEVGDKV